MDTNTLKKRVSEIIEGVSADDAFADPYSEFYGARGIIPLVYETLLYDI